MLTQYYHAFLNGLQWMKRGVISHKCMAYRNNFKNMLVLNLRKNDKCDFWESKGGLKAIWFKSVSGTNGAIVVLSHIIEFN